MSENVCTDTVHAQSALCPLMHDSATLSSKPMPKRHNEKSRKDMK